MGWCSGTAIFDAVAKYVLEQSTADEKHKTEVLTVLIEALHAARNGGGDADAR